MFTILELLIVIAIITILASIMLPSLKKAKESGRRGACAGNLRQIYLGLNHYADDYKEWFPGGAFNLKNAIGNGYNGKGLHRVMGRDYAITQNIVICPSSNFYTEEGNIPKAPFYKNEKSQGNGSAGAMSYWYIGGDGGYPTTSYYGWLESYFNPTQFAKGIRPTPTRIRVFNPSKCPLIWDISYRSDWTTGYDYWPNRSNHTSDGFTGAGTNMVFVDGHMSWIPLLQGVGNIRFGNLSDSTTKMWYY